MNDTYPQEIAICTRKLSKSYRHHNVLDQIDLEIPVGQCVGLIGANGAGKTTLLRCLAALLRPTRGELRWFGELVHGESYVRHLVGVVTHEHRLYPQLTLRENLVFAARMYGLSAPEQRAQQWLRRTALASFTDARPLQVSQGMRQRVAVAQALIHDPPIVLLDEPFSSLDDDSCEWLVELMAKVRCDGRTLCIASHDSAKTENLADRILCLQDGRLHERSPIRVPMMPDRARCARAA
jgi:ABC-type multidrug transport system ATPase subunit